MLNIRWFGVDTVDGIGIFFVGIILFLVGIAVSFVLLVLIWSTLSCAIERYVFYLTCRGTALRCKKKHALLRLFFNSYRGTDL